MNMVNENTRYSPVPVPGLFKRSLNFPEIQDKVDQVEIFPISWAKRLQQFDSVIAKMNEMIMSPEVISPDYYQDVLILKDQFGPKELPALSEILQKMTLKKHSKVDDAFLINNAYKMIRNQIGKGGDWSWVTQVTDPFQALSGLLIEGYGLALSYLYDGNPQIKRSFVKAFEEVLWTSGPSLLLRDVLPWIKEENKDFPSKIQQEILTKYPFL